jgi:hypothetical protein
MAAELRGRFGAAAGPAVVVGCGRNDGWRRRHPPGWWRTLVGPGFWQGRHGDIPGEAGLAWRRSVVAYPTVESARDGAGGRGGGAAHRRRRRR